MKKITNRFVKRELEYAMEESGVIFVTGPGGVGKHLIVDEVIGQNYVKLDMEKNKVGEFSKINPRAFLRSLPPHILIANIDKSYHLADAFGQLIHDLREKYRGFLPNIFLLLSSYTTPRTLDFSTRFQVSARVININPLLAAEILPSGDVNFLYNLFNRKFYPEKIENNFSIEDIAHRATFPYLLIEKNKRKFFDSLISKAANLHLYDESTREKFLLFIRYLANQIDHVMIEKQIIKNLKITKDEYNLFYEIAKSMNIFILLDQWSGRNERQSLEIIYILDTNLALYLRDEQKMDKNSELLIKNFICSELYKQQDLWVNYKLYHFQKYEECPIQFIIEDVNRAEIAAIDIKFKDHLEIEDTKDIIKFRNHAKQLCRKAYILYQGNRIIKFNNGIIGLPIAALWNSGEI